MAFWGLFKRGKKDINSLSTCYIKKQFAFLKKSGYTLDFCERNGEREFVYSFKNCTIEIYICDFHFGCTIKTEGFERTNLLETQFATSDFIAKFNLSSNIEKLEMIIVLLQKNKDKFYLI